MHPLFTFFGMLYDLLWGCFRSSSFQDHVPDETEHFVHKCFLGDNQQPTLGVINELWGGCLRLPLPRTLRDIFGALAVLLGVSRPKKCADPTLGSSTRILRNDQPNTRTSWYIMISRSEKGRGQGFHDKVPKTQPKIYCRMPRYKNPVYIDIYATCHVPQLVLFTSGDPSNELMVILV